MNTRSPISTISYNSPKFLKMKLDELIESRTISFYMFIQHVHEADELKDHIHLYVEPNKQLDTMVLQSYFKEPVPDDLPLGTIFWERSKYDDWILYDEHFEPYLISKGEKREFFYSKEDFVSSDQLDFDFRYQHAHFGSDWAKEQRVLDLLRDNDVFAYDLVLNGTVPLAKASQLTALLHLKNDKLSRLAEIQEKHKEEKVFRSGRKQTH